MAKCLRCGAGNEWIQGNVKNETLSSDAVLDDVRELLQMIDEIPCTCIEAYSARGLCAPDCPRCNWIEDDIVAKVRAHIV